MKNHSGGLGRAIACRLLTDATDMCRLIVSIPLVPHLRRIAPGLLRGFVLATALLLLTCFRQSEPWPGAGAAVTTQGAEQALLGGRIIPTDAAGKTTMTAPRSMSPLLSAAPRAQSGVIAFQTDRGGDFDVYVQSASGGAPASPLVTGLGNDWTPMWSPDGAQLVFASNRSGNYEIYLRAANGEERNLTNNLAEDAHPSWSPGGDRIIFVSNRSGSYFQIYTMRPDGADVRQVASIPGNNAMYPRFSPDGSRIAYMQASTSSAVCTWNWDVWVMNSNGSNPQRVTTQMLADLYPSWTPDGQTIVYASCRNWVDFDLYAINLTTGFETQINSWYGSNEWGPTFSPDADYMAFSTDIDGNSEIYVVSSAGGTATNLTQNAQSDLSASWKRASATFSISGRLTDASGKSIPGAIVSTGSISVTTSISGYYAIEGLAAGAYTLTPSKSGYTFSPPSRMVSVPPSAADQSFIGYGEGPDAAPNNSTMSVQPATLLADGSTESHITVQLLSVTGTPAWGKTVWLVSSRGSMDTIVQPLALTGGDGRTTGTIRSMTPGAAIVSAWVLDDGIQLSKSAAVTFQAYTPPSDAFLLRLNQCVDTAITSLGQIRDDADTVAADGDYFRGTIGANAAKLGTDIVFGMMDVVAGVQDWRQLNKGVQLALPGMTKYLDGPFWPTILNPAQTFPHASQLFRADVQLLVRGGSIQEMAGELAHAGAKFLGANLRDSGLEVVSQEVARQAVKTIFVDIDDGSTSIALPAVRDLANELADLLALQRRHLLSTLPVMSASYQSDYEGDLTGRVQALMILSRRLQDELTTLGNFRQVQDQQSNAILNFMLRFAAKSAATAIFDGPGSVAVGGTLLAFDSYMDGKQLGESVQMHSLAMDAILGAVDPLRQTYDIAYTGMNRIAHGLPANRATGQVTSVTHHSQGSGWGPFWSETAAWSDVSLTNTGQSETTYHVLTSYLADTQRFGLPWATMNMVEEGTIILAPGASGTVRIDYKRADGTKGFSPRTRTCILWDCVPASPIDIDVLGNNEAGTYYIGGYSGEWRPVSQTGAHALATANDLPVIDPPITTYVLSAPWLQEYEAQIWINNPFTSTVSVTVTQTITPAITLLDIGQASRKGTRLTWNTTVSPSAMSLVTFTFGYTATPGTNNALPGATLSLVNPLDSQWLTAESNTAGFQAIWPVTLERATPGYVLPGSRPRIMVTVTNWLRDSTVTGTLGISVTDASSATKYEEYRSFSVAMQATSGFSFTLPATLSPGNYMVLGYLDTRGASTKAWSDPLQVGLPGPLVDYWVSAKGAVNPGDLLTYTLQFTNTTGTVLSAAVVTASVPMSVSVIASSVTESGVVEANQILWTLGTIGMDQAIRESFTARVNTDAAPSGTEPTRLLSEPRLTANEIAPTWGPLAWNLVKQIYRVYLPIGLRSR